MLAPDEVARLIAATTCLKYRAVLEVAYGAGLRVAEVAALKVGEINSERMLISVVRGKGGRSRHALLSPDLELITIADSPVRSRSGKKADSGEPSPCHRS